MKTGWYKEMVQKFNALSKEIESMKEVVILKQQRYTTIDYNCLYDSHSWFVFRNMAECSRCGQILIQRFKIYP